MNIKIISAGAGSGKTYRLTEEMVRLISGESGVAIRPSGIFATTFTNKAAAELQERVRVKLLERGMSEAADALSNALIGTVHALGVRLLRRFAFEAGVSPQVEIMAEEDGQAFFNNALSMVLTEARMVRMQELSERLGYGAEEHSDWRNEVRKITDHARANGFDETTLRQSAAYSVASFAAYLPSPNTQRADWFQQQLHRELTAALHALPLEDKTQKTIDFKNAVQQLLNKLNNEATLSWYDWVQLLNKDCGAKSRKAVEPLKAFLAQHEAIPEFREDIANFTHELFDIGIAALHEYERYKKERGLIDYIDMEVLVERLLRQPDVREMLTQELDLLMVDEFQDTSPIELALFLQLSRIAKISIWVGDPKQSIYGFRGADPSLMQAIITASGGIKPQDIQTTSWRSREEIVNACNALFVKAFDQLPPEQVALQPHRTAANDPIEMGCGIIQWHYTFEGKKYPPKWLENAIAQSVREWLARGDIYVLPKNGKKARPLIPSDIAILCRSNHTCHAIADALHREGVQVAIARTGLLRTAEAKLILACLKYLYHAGDSLSIAEILLLGVHQPIADIVTNRFEFLNLIAQKNKKESAWSAEETLLAQLDILRNEVGELSSVEIVNLVLETLDLKRTISAWGNVAQRYANIDALRQYAIQYEAACNRLHTAASLGGFLLWLNELEQNNADQQGAGESDDTVHVLTYHKSKGLEWQFVICHDIENDLKNEVWGAAIVAQNSVIDLDNVLENRWIRYWVRPYGNKVKKTALYERIEQGSEQRQTTDTALNEEARLLYVGFTRARDYLVIPTRQKPTRWLNRVWNKNMEDVPTLLHNDHETPWIWANQPIVKHTEIWDLPADFAYREVAQSPVLYYSSKANNAVHRPYFCDIEREDYSSWLRVQCLTPINYGETVALPDSINTHRAARLIKAMIAADQPQRDELTRKNMAHELMHRHGIINEEWENIPLLVIAETFWKVCQSWQPTKIMRKIPIRTYQQERLFEKIVDVILFTADAIIIIQHSGFVGDAKKVKAKAQQLAAWHYFAAKAVRETTASTLPIRTFWHFVLLQTFVEVQTTAKSQLLIF